MAMGVLLRRNHRRVAANMVEVSVGLSAFLPRLFVCLSVCLACRSLALLEMSRRGLFRGGLGWFRGGENWSSVWIGPRRGNCDMQPQTGGQKVERSEMNLLPYMGAPRHTTQGKKEPAVRGVPCHKQSGRPRSRTPSLSPELPCTCNLHLQLALQLYLGPRLRSTVANSQAGGTDLDSPAS